MAQWASDYAKKGTDSIGAKLEKALDRRLSKQDAMPPVITEKKR